MRIGFLSLCVTAVLAVSVSLVGCGSDSTETPTEKIEGSPPPIASEADQDEHAGHDHGADAGAEHPTEGPHGGHLIELGDEKYHAELLHDEKTHAVTVHLLDAAGKEPVAAPLEEITLQLFQDGQFVKYALKAVQAQGGASQFEIIDEALCDALCHEDELRGRIQVTINGKPYTGTIEHSSHEGHDHEGDAHEGDDHKGHDHVGGDDEGHDHE